MASRPSLGEVTLRLGDWRWRLNNLYWITDKEGREVPFRMNWAQEALFDGMHYLNVILKARQLGFSTFIAIFMLDVCVFSANVSAGIIDATIDDAKGKLEKIEFAYKRLPAWLQQANRIDTENAFEIRWRNGSSISVGTSHRGGTLQYLHVSEFGKICAKYPDKAREIITGALNTVQAGQIVFIESTAEGQSGRFFDICQTAQAKARTRADLTPLDFKFHFFPWWKAPEYVLDVEGVVVPSEMAAYFAKLEGAGIKLSPAQWAWYAKKAETQFDDMKREYPSTPEEAFEASVEGAILGRWVEEAEATGRVGAFPAVPGVPVHTFWDIGRQDYNSIWFAQILMGPRIRVVGYHQDVLKEMPDYAALILGTEAVAPKFPKHLFKQRHEGLFKERGWVKGTDYVPHDGRQKEWGSGRGRLEQMKDAGLTPEIGGELSLHDGINASRATLAHCEIDAAECAEGLRVLKGYRWEWDEQRAVWKTGTPYHDDCSHGADGFRTLATTWREIVPALPTAMGAIDDLIRPRTYAEVMGELGSDDDD